jgi:Zn-dependent protease with chaperone function
VSVAVCLLLYSLTIMVAGPPVLRVLTRHGHAPRFGVGAWLVAIGTVLLSWLAAAGMIVIDLVTHWSYPRVLVHSCLTWVHVMVSDNAGVAAITLAVIAAALALLAAVSSVRLARTVARMRARACAHAAAVQMVGHRNGGAYVVVEAEEPAAYCVSGRPPAIVVTSAALAALNDDELAAVLAHERAHLNGHHSVVVTTLRGLAAVFPKLTLMREGASEVSRLLEMCADDASARRHGPAVLLSGLITMCRTTPAGALAAADVAVLARAERLATPPRDPAVARARAALISLIAVMVAAPVMTAALAASGVPICGM